MSKTKSAFTIYEASVILPNMGEDEKSVDIRANVLEIDFFENIHKPYVDARIAILDDFGFKNTLSIQGTERIRLTIKDGTDDEGAAIIKYFFISKVNQTKRVNERSEVVSFDLVEDHVYVNAVKQISRSYSENIENIITDICTNDLKKKVVRNFFNTTAQGVRKVIVPYLSPLEAVQWLKTRATTRTGSPIFLHGDLYSNNLYLSDLDTLLGQQDVINKKLPMRYVTSASSTPAEEESLRPYYEIISYREVDAEDTLGLYENGAIGSGYANLDAGTGVSIDAHISVRDIIDEFYTNGLISVQSAQTIYDPSLVIDGKLSDEYNSLNIFQVTSSKTYNQFMSIHDEAIVLDQNNDIAESKLKVKNKIIRHILKRNTIEIGMNGAFFLEGRVPVGTKLRILFLNPDVNKNKKEIKDQIDKRKSGDYLLLATNHKMTQERHTVVLRLTKLGELPSDFAL